MKATNHTIVHQYQPTNASCSQTALSMLFECYGVSKTVPEIEAEVPQYINEKGENCGTVNHQLAAWCLAQSFEVILYTFDCQVIDQSWSKLTTTQLLERLKLRKNGWGVPALGKAWTQQYVQAYIDFVEQGGVLQIEPVVTSRLMYDLLESGPFLPCVCFSTMYGTGRFNNQGEANSVADDINGKAINHSVVVYGNDEDGNFLVADPWQKPGLHVVEPERLIAAISTAQIECDNMLFQINKKQ